MLIQQNDLSLRNATTSDANIFGTWWRVGKVMAHAGLQWTYDFKRRNCRRVVETN